MTISDKTRKILWGRSGNRCALCRRELVMAGDDSNGDSIIGEECHIVAKSTTGPRGNYPLETGKRDLYDNLILLCRVHHKLIDDQPNKYTVNFLLKLKREHEEWVRNALSQSHTGKEKKHSEFFVYRIDTGTQLSHVVGGSHAYYFENDSPKNDDEMGLIASFLQTCQDYADIWSEIEAGGRVQAQYEMDMLLKELEKHDFVVYGSLHSERIKIGSRQLHEHWDVAYIFVLRKSNPLTKRKDELVEAIYPQSTLISQKNDCTNFILIRRSSV